MLPMISWLSPLPTCPIRLFVRVIGAAHEWSRLHMTKPHLFALGLQGGKFFQRHIALYGQMLERWAQVLADSQDVDIMLAHIVHHLDHLIPCFAQSQHEAGLGWRGSIHL